MRIFVLGANGKTGVELLDLALARRHQVTAFVRSPEKIQRRDAGLSVMRGDPRDAGAMAGAMHGHDVVVSALGPRPREAFTRSTLLRDCATPTVEAMRRAGVQRLSVVSSALLFPRTGPLFALFRLLMRPHVSDLQAMEQLVESSGLDWTIARPPRLLKNHDEAYRSQDGGLPPGAWSMSFRAVGCFLLDAAEQRRHVRQVVGLAGT